ncbi:hypothetical protein ACFOEE_16015 [Pseudoalteromonas fenneropenaei]|uniref:Lipoprotein n=1 Tax=Pseudoalteromonas fenneropenaei TaxID=1737459 RepID=A0ABV7CMX7_9GAMM
MKYSILLCSLFLFGCASSQSPVFQSNDVMALRKVAAEQYPQKLAVESELLIQKVGEQFGAYYLNTELDHRDPRNISIDIPVKLVAEFKQLHQVTLEEYYTGKRVRVIGELEQAMICFHRGGCELNRYYYQTHIQVTSLAQIQLMQ